MKIQRNKIAFFVLDVTLVILSFLVSLLLRFDFEIPLSTIVDLPKHLPFILFAKLFSFYFFGLYKGMWRYTSLSDLVNIVKASSLGSLISLSLLALLFGLDGFPRSIIFIDYIFCTAGLCLTRISIRFYYNHHSQNQIFKNSKRYNKLRKKIIIIGAGNSSEKIIREIGDNNDLKYLVVGF